MPAITVRDVPDDVRDELAARASSAGRSLQEYLRLELIALAARPNVETLMERVRQRKAATRSSLGAAEILELRDSERR